MPVLWCSMWPQLWPGQAPGHLFPDVTLGSHPALLWPQGPGWQSQQQSQAPPAPGPAHSPAYAGCRVRGLHTCRADKPSHLHAYPGGSQLSQVWQPALLVSPPLLRGCSRCSGKVFVIWILETPSDSTGSAPACQSGATGAPGPEAGGRGHYILSSWLRLGCRQGDGGMAASLRENTTRTDLPATNLLQMRTLQVITSQANGYFEPRSSSSKTRKAHVHMHTQ